MSPRQSHRPHVFISYYAHGTDLDVATSLRAALVKNKVKVPAWRDKEELRPGTKMAQDIQRAIDECDYLLLLVSPRSLTKSRWCPREWRRADRLGKTIIPLIAEDVEGRDWPLELEEHQWLDFKQGVRFGLPALLAALGVSGVAYPVGRDPLDRDDDAIRAIALLFYYFAGTGLVPLPNVQAAVRGLKPCVETERASKIIDATCEGFFPDCRAAGVWMLEQWASPATRGGRSSAGRT